MRVVELVLVLVVGLTVGPWWAVLLVCGVEAVLDWRSWPGAVELAGRISSRVAEGLVPAEAVELGGRVDPAEHYRHEHYSMHAPGPALDLGAGSPLDRLLVDDELDPYPRPPFVEGRFVGHDHASLRGRPTTVEVALRVETFADLADRGILPEELGDGRCRDCQGPIIPAAWNVPVGLAFDGFAPGAPRCGLCALRDAAGLGDTVWISDAVSIRPGPGSRSRRLVVVPSGSFEVVEAVDVPARLAEEEGR